MRGALGVLLVAGLLIRAALWTVYEPVTYPDTATYMKVAGHIMRADFSGYDGRRTPGYPLVLAAAGLDGHAAWLLQMLEGLVISASLFFVALRLTDRPAVAAAVGMSYNVNLAQLFFEADLLSETTSALAVTGTVVMLIAVADRLRRGRRAAGRALILGVLSGVAALVRPQFVFLPLLAALLLAWSASPSWRRAVSYAVSTALPGALLILSWCTVNYVHTGFFTLSTQTGIGLFDHSLAFIELAPDRYATIREIGLKHRNAKMAATGMHSASWEALPELMSVTGRSLPAVSQELQRMSVELFARHPLRYLAGVAHAWIDFWMAPIYWKTESLHAPALATWLARLWRVEHPLIRLANGLFVALVVVAVLSRRFRARCRWDVSLTGLSAVVMMSSLVQASAIWVENARYAIPVQPLVILVVAVVAARQFAGVTVSPRLAAVRSVVERNP